uniref:Uncharacterized protein n=1 Tax=Glossina pallidipes TaxID=7398 RepID=A0A1A9ZGS1_GLOPL
MYILTVLNGSNKNNINDTNNSTAKESNAISSSEPLSLYHQSKKPERENISSESVRCYRRAGKLKDKKRVKENKQINLSGSFLTLSSANARPFVCWVLMKNLQDCTVKPLQNSASGFLWAYNKRFDKPYHDCDLRGQR